MNLYRMNSKTVSIVLPTFNRAGLLPRAINSVINQTWTDWELLVIDDGSSDETGSLINQYCEKDGRIFYWKKPHRGLPRTMNEGIELCKGRYVTFLGSDDEYKPNHLKLRIEIFDEDEKLDFLHGGVEVVGNPLVRDKRNRSKLIRLKDCIIGGTFFGKRNVFWESGGFKNVDYSEDSEFFERISKKYTCRKIDFPTYIYYRDTPGSICNSI